MEATNLIEFYNQFASEEKCQEFLIRQRWGDEIVCPKCGVVGVKAYRLASGRLKCAECRKPFTVRMGSVFEDSKIPLQKWFFAIYLCTSLKKGVSSIQLAKYLGVTQKTSWFVLQRIRYVFENGTFEKLKNTVEMDEAYIGGNEKNKHASMKTKTPVVGMVERQGKLHAVVTSDTGSKTLMNLVRKHINRLRG
jgi:transposase-like protein